MKYALTLSYEGTAYCGWQVQKDQARASIQSTMSKALLKISGEQVSVVGSGRTDAGVHALAQVAHIRLEKKEWEVGILRKALNALLPPSIRVTSVAQVPDEFHAQRSALSKQYSYYFLQGPSNLPHMSPYSWWIRKDLDVGGMNEALGYLLGEHDFEPFRASGAVPGTTVRKILEGKVTRKELDRSPFGYAPADSGYSLIRVRVRGTGFLKQMVRGIAGTLLQVGEGKRPPSCTHEILAIGDRKLVGPTAPGRGLWLERVWYDQPLKG